MVLDVLDLKVFLLNRIEDFPQYVLFNSFPARNTEFKKPVKAFSVSDVPIDKVIISSHTVYKLSVGNDDYFFLEALNVPHRNNSCLKNILYSDFSMCSRFGMGIVLSLAALQRWPFVIADVKAAFLKLKRAEIRLCLCTP